MAKLHKDLILYTDISKKDTRTKSGDIEALQNENSVLEIVSNTLLRRSGFGPMGEMETGSFLEDFLFEPIDSITANNIVNEIERALEFEKRIKNLYIEVTPLVEENTFEILIDFQMDLTPNKLRVTTTLDKLR